MPEEPAQDSKEDAAAASELNDAVVYIIDDDAQSREATLRLLADLGVPVHAFDSTSAFMDGYDPARIACLLMGLGRNLRPLIDVLSTLKRVDDGLPVILVAPDTDVTTAVAAFKAGAFDLVEPPLKRQTLFETVVRAIVHRREALHQLRARLVATARFAKLSRREHEILRLVVAGFTTAEIAHRLSRSPKTIEAHRSRILAKSETGSVGELVQLAIRAGFTGGADSREGDDCARQDSNL